MTRWVSRYTEIQPNLAFHTSCDEGLVTTQLSEHRAALESLRITAPIHPNRLVPARPLDSISEIASVRSNADKKHSYVKSRPGVSRANLAQNFKR